MTDSLELLRSTKTVLLTTYKRDGSAVETPVSIAFDGQRVFFRTWHKAGKARRLANNPRVKVAPCTFRGRVAGPTMEAQARLLQGNDAKIAANALAKRHPVLQAILVPLAHRLMRYRTMHYQLLLDAEERKQ